MRSRQIRTGSNEGSWVLAHDHTIFEREREKETNEGKNAAWLNGIEASGSLPFTEVKGREKERRK